MESSVADAIVEAIRRAATAHSSTTATSGIPPTASSVYSRVSSIGSQNSNRSDSNPVETTGSTSGQKRKFTVPTMFQSKRLKSSKAKPKSVKYLRDIFCLPEECEGKNGTIVIPRGTRRSALANKDVGLMGKIEFESEWSADRMNKEICNVFSKPFGLSADNIASGKMFEFQYLQRTGAGSRTLCVPTVTTSFEWNGRQVATLAKSGSVIYILAREHIPVLWKSDDSSNSNSPSSSPPRGSPLSAMFPVDSSLNEPPVLLEDRPLPSPDAVSPPSSPDLPPAFNYFERSKDCPIIYVNSDDDVRIDPDLTAYTDVRSNVSDTLQCGFEQDDAAMTIGVEHDTAMTPLSSLVSMFESRLSRKQVKAVYDTTGKSFDDSMECLLPGPTSTSLTDMLSRRFSRFPVSKVNVDPDDIWQDMVVYYKSDNIDLVNKIRIRLQGRPVCDTGGVRKEMYTTVLNDFQVNAFVGLFDGAAHSLHPRCTAQSRSCGLYKVLGSIVGHSISQDGIGFPCLSLTSYWYMAAGEDRALEFASVEDVYVGADVSSIISKVKDVASEEDAISVMTDELALDVFNQCGITAVLDVSSKDIIAQDILTHEAIYKHSKLLDQFCEG